MPPRGEHSPAELKALILRAAGDIADRDGIRGLTARAIEPGSCAQEGNGKRRTWR